MLDHCAEVLCCFEGLADEQLESLLVAALQYEIRSFYLESFSLEDKFFSLIKLSFWQWGNLGPGVIHFF